MHKFFLFGYRVHKLVISGKRIMIELKWKQTNRLSIGLESSQTEKCQNVKEFKTKTFHEPSRRIILRLKTPSYSILNNKYLDKWNKSIMADIETAEFLIDESLLKLSVERLVFICNFLEINDDCSMGHSKRTIFKKINKYMDNFKEQNFWFATLELLYKIQSKSKELKKERTRPETDAYMLIIRPYSKQFEDLDASIQEVRELAVRRKEKGNKVSDNEGNKVSGKYEAWWWKWCSRYKCFSVRDLSGSAALLRRELRGRGCVGDPSQKDMPRYISIKHQISELRK